MPLLNSGRVELLDHKRLVAQLCSLERRTTRGGKDSIDHPPGSFDDIANCVAGVAAVALRAARVEEPNWVPPFVHFGRPLGGSISIRDEWSPRW